MFLRTWMVMWKEFIQIRRDPRMLTVVALFPIILLVIYGYAINLDVKHLRLAVCDLDRTHVSRDFISIFVNNEYFDLVRIIFSPREIDSLLDRGSAKAVLVIPKGFARDIASNLDVTVQIIIDGSDSTPATTAIGYAGGMMQQFSSKVLVDAIQKKGIRTSESMIPLENRTRYWYNTELKSTNFIIPGLIAVILMMLSTLLTSMTVVRERERGTIESLIVSPIRPVELMMGKLIPYVIIAFLDVIMVLAAALFIFEVPLKGDLTLVLALSGIFLTAALGIGLLVSTLASTQQMAMTVALIGSQLPTVLLSGFIFPIASMPVFIQWVTTLIPATHFVKILRGIFLKGSGIQVLLVPSIALFSIGSIIIFLCAVSFKKKL